jgi:hypothetical protein
MCLRIYACIYCVAGIRPRSMLAVCMSASARTKVHDLRRHVDSVRPTTPVRLCPYNPTELRLHPYDSNTAELRSKLSELPNKPSSSQASHPSYLTSRQARTSRHALYYTWTTIKLSHALMFSQYSPISVYRHNVSPNCFLHVCSPNDFSNPQTVMLMLGRL